MNLSARSEKWMDLAATLRAIDLTFVPTSEVRLARRLQREGYDMEFKDYAILYGMDILRTATYVGLALAEFSG